LRVADAIHIWICTEEPPQHRIVNPAVHVHQPEVVELFVVSEAPGELAAGR
jgi:hypothetical protein